MSAVEWVHRFDDTDCWDGGVERDPRYAGIYWCAEGREVEMTGARPPAPPLSFEERQTVRRFEAAPDPFCPRCDGEGRMQARLPHMRYWTVIPCPCIPVTS